jgi:plasmid maintenance system antidote protein VapI
MGYTHAKIAEMFNIARSTVEHICNNRTWRHLND